MKLVHHSQHVLRGPIRCPAQGEGHTGMGKPHGFWFSVKGEMDWEDWCRSARFRLDGLRYEYRIKLNPAYPILLIDTVEKMEWFHRCFADKPLTASSSNRFTMIDWVPVCWAWAGIIIAPYVWSRQMDLFWYYGWDCASGVVWNEDAVRGYERIK